MKFTRFIVLLFLSLSVLFPLLNGCGEDDDPMPTPNDGPDILTGQHIASRGRITDIEYFEDRWILASNPSEIVIYDKDLHVLALLRGHPSQVETIEIFKNAEAFFIFIGCSDGTIRTWYADKIEADIADKASVGVLEFTKNNENYYEDIPKKEGEFVGSVKSLATSSSDSKLLVGGSGDGNVILYEVKADVQDIELSDKFEQGHDSTVTALAFSPDGNFFASGGSGKMTKMLGYGIISKAKTQKLFRAINTRL